MNNKVMIIKARNDIFPNYTNIYTYYFNSSKYNIIKILFKISLKYNLPTIKLFFSDWKNHVNEYSSFILFDSGLNNYIINFIKKNNKKSKIIVWYWNGLVEHKFKLLKNKYIDEIWTYNKFDAEKYHLKFNTQFYFRENEIKNKNVMIDTDILFLGKDKGRKKEILDLKNIFEDYNLKCDFHIIEKSSDFIKYSDYLNLVNNSKCILDFNYILPGGLTLRPLEAIFFEKKLITNNKDIVNYSFYDKDNIFIIGEDDINNIYEFINKPYKKINDEIKNYYSFDEWLTRIINNIETK